MDRKFTLYLLIGLGALAALGGCGAPASVAPTTAPPPTTIVLPTLPPVGPTLLSSDYGQSRATRVPSQDGQPQTPVPSVAPSATPSASGFEYALRSRFADELDLVNNETVYTINWEINDDLSQIQGQQRVIFANNTGAPLYQIYFRLFANYPHGAGDIRINSVETRGRALPYTLEAEDTALRVELDRPLAPGEVQILTLEYTIDVPSMNTIRYGEFIRSEWVTTLPSLYPIVPRYDQNGWHLQVPPAYGDLVFADSSVYDVRITAPSRYNVITSGQLIEESSNGSRTTRRFIGAPMRDFDVNLTDSLTAASTQLDDITINSWFLPEHAEPGQRALNWTRDAIIVFENRFGPYPFKELDIVESPTSAGGIEYPGLYTLSTRLYGDPGQLNFFEFAAVHETAHQWFYSTVGSDQVNHPWLDEALAQYATLVYFEDRYGPEQGRIIQEQYFDPQYETAKQKYGDSPAGLPIGAYDEEAYNAFIYAKGPKFFQAVRERIGDSAFFAALENYYADFKFRVAYPSDLVNAFNAASGEDITPLYRQWIVGE
ncbi:MAG: M1 family metallopeptidase [Anaerolineae bacterium]|nr:M1 family metallopeptidase [Anaerolineae bacterium]